MDNEVLHEINASLREIKDSVLELVKQNAVVTTKVEHIESKVIDLQIKIKPLEEAYITTTRAVKIAGGFGALMSCILVINRLLRSIY